MFKSLAITSSEALFLVIITRMLWKLCNDVYLVFLPLISGETVRAMGHDILLLILK